MILRDAAVTAASRFDIFGGVDNGRVKMYNNTCGKLLLREDFRVKIMSENNAAFAGAKWIGAPRKTENTDGLDEYIIEARFRPERGSRVGLAAAARDKDNCVLFYIDTKDKSITVTDRRDNAWSPDRAAHITERVLYRAEAKDALRGKDVHLLLRVEKRSVRLTVNGIAVIDGEELIPETGWFEPRKTCMLDIGFDARGSRIVLEKLEARGLDGRLLQSGSFENGWGAFSCLGAAGDDGLVIEDAFELAVPIPAVNVMKRFGVKSRLRSARLSASALGFYEVYINGKKAGRDHYAPGFTDYRKRIYYQTYDVTEMIKNGDNIISATAAKGYYSGYVGYTPRPMVYGKQNAFIACLSLEYEDGSRETVVTDESWLFTDNGPVRNADFLQGEEYDARLELSEDSGWTRCGTVPLCTEVKPANGELENEPFVFEPQRGPSAEIERVLTARSEHQAPDGHFIFDLGQNMVGTVRVRFNGRRGTSLRLRYGEMCRSDGSLYTANLRSAANTDIYTLKGGGSEEFVPSFTAHGFRYVEISGNGFDLTQDVASELIESVEGLVITNTRETTGSFECSNKALDRLQSNIEWGQRGNSLLVFTDCPQRNERMGWTGDIQVFVRTAAYNMDIKEFARKWLTDLRDAQLMYNRGGAVPDTAPLGGDNRAHGGCAGWGDAAVIVPWELYTAYGDRRILEENYDMMRAWVEERSGNVYNGVRTVDGAAVPECSDLAENIQKQPPRGDHLAYDETTPFILTATAYAARTAELMSRTAEVLGRADDARRYAKLHKKYVKAFRDAWVCEDGSIAYWGEMSKCGADAAGDIINRTRYGEGYRTGASQTAYALAIDFGLIPEDGLRNAARCFKRAVETNGGRLSVGFLGISHLLPALEKAGLTDTAFELLECDRDPSWLYSVKNGATTIWERWNSYIAETGTFGDVSMNSFNHYAYGSVGEWLFGTVLGINTETSPEGVGYRRIILKPTPGGSLTYAKGSYKSAAGLIRSEWRLEDGRFIYGCVVPKGSRAVLYLPGTPCNAETAVRENGRAVLELESGEYRFICET